MTGGYRKDKTMLAVSVSGRLNKKKAASICIINTKWQQKIDNAQQSSLRQNPTCGRPADWEENLEVETLLLRTPSGECNCISLRSTRSVHFEWVNIGRVKSFVSGAKFTIFFSSNVEGIVVDSFPACRLHRRTDGRTFTWFYILSNAYALHCIGQTVSCRISETVQETSQGYYWSPIGRRAFHLLTVELWNTDNWQLSLLNTHLQLESWIAEYIHQQATMQEVWCKVLSEL